MPVDDCKNTFDELAREVLPGLMKQLRALMKRPASMSEFSQQGIGVATLMKRFGLKSDPRACYVIIDKRHPIYVGISKCVIKRLMEHVRGSDHLTATLAYRIAATKHPHGKTASEAMKDTKFHKRFIEQRDYIRGLDVAFIVSFRQACVKNRNGGVTIGYQA